MLNQLFAKFKNSTILVIGDVMIDAYLIGNVGRISPEAPVPIVDIKKREYRLGGAANVALNLKSLGAAPILCSVVGNNEKGKCFLNLLEEENLTDNGIYISQNRKTTIKYRIIGNKSQMIRVDEEESSCLDEEEQNAFYTIIKNMIEQREIEAIIFEDYDKGVISKELIEKIVVLAQKRNIITAVDPKKRNFGYYEGVTLFKPNLKELYEGTHEKNDGFSMDQIRQIMQQFSHEKNIDLMMVTLSEKGMAIYEKENNIFYSQPAFLRKISDVSGAGDTVISVATLCLTAGLAAKEIALISNLSGGIVCEYSGVVPIEKDRLKEEIVKEFPHILREISDT